MGQAVSYTKLSTKNMAFLTFRETYFTTLGQAVSYTKFGTKTWFSFLMFREAYYPTSYLTSVLALLIVFSLKARGDGLVTVDMGLPELNGPKVPTTLPTNGEGMVLTEPITVRERELLHCSMFVFCCFGCCAAIAAAC